MSFANVERNAWRALFAAQAGWMLDAMDFLLFTFAIVPIQKEFGLSGATMGGLTSVALVAGAIGGIAFGRIADAIGRVRAMTDFMGARMKRATPGQPVEVLGFDGVPEAGEPVRVVENERRARQLGGEWSCGSVLVAESWPAEHRAKAMGIMQSGWAIGALIAAALSALILADYGWRVLFLVGALPAVAAFIIRRKVEEPPLWMRRTKEPSRWGEMFSAPFIRRTVVATMLSSSVLVAYWGVMTWLPTFLATPVAQGGGGLTITRSAAWLITLQIGAFAGYISFGWFADKFGRRAAFTFFMIAATIVVPLFAFEARSPLALVVICPLVGYFCHGYYSVFGAVLAELYPTRFRASAQGFCYNAGRLASAAAPLAIGAAAKSYGLGLAIAVDSMFFAVGAVLIWMLPETKGAEL